MKRELLFLFLSGLLFFTGSAYSQVGINTEDPYKITELHVKNLVEGTDTIPKGIMIPRLREVQRDEIDVSEVDFANSIMIYNIDEDCYNYYSKTEAEWQSLCGKMGKAQFTTDCSSISVHGTYGDGVPLNTSNYIKVTVNVTKIGSYTISAVASPDNGYFYETEGTFYSLGEFTLTIAGTGEPVKHTQGDNLLSADDDTPDKFTLSTSSAGEGCPFEVNVRSTAARPEFTIDCGATVVEGMYFEDQPLSSVPNEINNQSHRIKVVLKNIPATSYGAVAALETNTVDGISFKGEAVLSSSTQEIYLEGTGTPRGLSDKHMTITSNSETSNASCEAVVFMLIPRKRLMTLGNDTNSYGYNLGLPTSRTGADGYTSGNDLLTDKNNFGYNQWSILKFAGFSNLGTAGSANQPPSGSAINTWTDDGRDILCLNTARWRALTPATLESLLKGTNGYTKVDIFMIGYNTEFYRNNNADDAARCQLLVDFVKTGGILMICSEETDSNGNFMNMLFDYPTPAIGSEGGAGAGSNYTLGFNSDNTPANMKPYYCKDNDPILAGPFEDIVGKNWAEDASTTRYVTNLPLDQVVIYSGARPIGNTSQPAEGVTIFRHKEYPFVFIGDGGFNSNRRRNDVASDNICPFQLTNKTINGRTYTHYPTFRLNIGGSGNRAYNAVFTANAFAWCIEKAEEYRRNNK